MSAYPFFASIPNLITVARLFLVPLIVVMISNHAWQTAFVIFLAAGVSDAVDGFIAKRFNLRTELGAYLDPIADKALLVSIYVSLAIAGILPTALAVLVVSRDIMIVGAVMISWIVDKPVEIKPLMISKFNTAAQIAFAAFVLAVQAFSLSAGDWMLGAMATVAALTLASMAAYLAQWLKHMAT